MDYTNLFQKPPALTQHMIGKVGLCLVFCLMVGCAQTNQYTSKDLTILPCESKANEFFFPLEFDDAGHQVYADQAPAIEKALHHAQRVYVFVHGWNKTPDLAERDYQDLICRFYMHSKRDEVNAKRSIIIGVFWPSADFPPLLNFWRMKNRADDLALTGFQSLIKLLADPAIESGGHYDLVLIGHSFGGRIILKGISHYIAQLTQEKHRFFSSLNQLQLVLLTTAASENILLPYQQVHDEYSVLKREWDPEVFRQEIVKQYGREFSQEEILVDVLKLRLRWHPTLVELAGLTDLRIFNIYSIHDGANRFLYPVFSSMEPGGPACAIGACGVIPWREGVSVTSAGSVNSKMDLALSNLWNVDASKIIFSHTDIYKGRIANLLWELIDLPQPQYVHYPEMPPKSLQGTDLQVRITGENMLAMLKVNRVRQMGEAELKSVNASNALAFAIDEELEKENWGAAEKGIKEITKLHYLYPGWFADYGMGIIYNNLFLNVSDTRAEWNPLTWDSIHVLLAYVLLKQGKCAEAAEVLDQLRKTSPSFQREEKIALEKLGSHKIRLLNCQYE